MSKRVGSCTVCGTRYRVPTTIRGAVARCGKCGGRAIIRLFVRRRETSEDFKPPMKVVVVLCVAAVLAVIGVTAGLVSVTLSGDPALLRQDSSEPSVLPVPPVTGPDGPLAPR